ncbi:MAG: response regulator [Candidatus Kapabacteria bacterium]|nr:response regulator [Candidatus Kapabacteria bacterium]
MANFLETRVFSDTLLDNFASAVLAIDKEGIILFCNRSAEELLGYTADELVKKQNISILQDKETVENLRDELSQTFGIKNLTDVGLLFAAAERSHRQRRIWKYRAKNGRVISVEMALSVLEHHQSATQDLFITARNIEEQQGLAELKVELLSRLSHEMRTPLHGIIGALELLASTPLAPEQKEILALARSKSDILVSLINDIFEYSRSQGRSLSLERVPAEPRAIMRNIVEVLSERISSRDIAITSAIDEAVPNQILCDPVRLYQVLMTVVSILASFMNDGTIHLALEFLPSASEEFGGLYFTIRGAATTINVQKRGQILALIQHEEESPDVSAESLQLSLARSVIMAMGGFFWSEKKEYVNDNETIMHIVVSVESADETNSGNLPTDAAHTHDSERTVDNTIVANRSTSSAEKEALTRKSDFGNTSQAHTQPGTTGIGRRILIVDDDPDNCQLAALFLRGLNDKQGNAPLITIANNGLEALGEAQKIRFDVILMDVQMPLMDGFEATECIRAFEANNHFKRTPILAVTAHTMENYRELCLQKGMDDYMSKPVKKQQLQEFVQKWLDRKPIIIVADDSDDYRLLLKLQFDKQKQYSIIFATNGQEVLNLCQNHDVDAILLDMQMPIMTGYEAAPILRQMPKYSTIPIWGLTAHEGLPEIEKVLAVGCDRCFTKGNLSVIRQIIAGFDEYFLLSQTIQ